MSALLPFLIPVAVWIGKRVRNAEKVVCIFVLLKIYDKFWSLPTDVPQGTETIYAFALFKFSKSATKEQIGYFFDKRVQEQFFKDKAARTHDICRNQLSLSGTLAVRDDLQCDDEEFRVLITRFSECFFQAADDSIPMGLARAIKGDKLAALQKKTEAESEGARIPNAIKSEQIQEKCSKLRNCYSREETSTKCLDELAETEVWISEFKSALSNQDLFVLYFEMAMLGKYVAEKSSGKERLLHSDRAEKFALIAKGYENEVDE